MLYQEALARGIYLSDWNRLNHQQKQTYSDNSGAYMSGYEWFVMCMNDRENKKQKVKHTY